MFPDNKMKALTFSYDDGVTQDRQLIRILNRYGLKATFNINSGKLGVAESASNGHITAPHVKVLPTEVKALYEGHEVAAHTCTHPLLIRLPDDEVLRQVEDDRKALEELVGYKIVGMAYPGGAPNYDERVAELLRTKTDLAYCRTIESNGAFEPQTDLIRLKPTVYHMDWANMWAMAHRFVEAKPDSPQIFYIWGHSYEFDFCDGWTEFEAFCRFISGRSDIYYGTNKEVLL